MNSSKLILFALLWFIAVPAPSHAESPAKTYFLETENRKIHIPFYSISHFTVNDVCKKNLSECKAYDLAVHHPFSIFPADWKKYGNPAAAFCAKEGGTALDLLDENGNEVGFCAFSDQSIIDSWSFYVEATKK